VVVRSRAFNLVQSTPACLRDLAKLFAILWKIGSRPVTKAYVPPQSDEVGLRSRSVQRVIPHALIGNIDDKSAIRTAFVTKRAADECA
jgi:hypothetical protein